jgi:hypothetical protein
MSPEQAQGCRSTRGPTSSRSVCSFYEMLTGAKPFGGNTTIALLAAVVNQEPRPVREITDLPLDVERLLSRCLRKSADRRIQTMADLHAALVDLKEESDSGKLSSVAGTAVARPSTRRQMACGRQSPAAAVIAAGAAWWTLGWKPPVRTPGRPIKITNYTNAHAIRPCRLMALRWRFSWGGEKVGNWDIYVKQIIESEPHRLTTDPGSIRWPLWYSDGTRIMFRRGDAVYSMSALGSGSSESSPGGLPFPSQPRLAARCRGRPTANAGDRFAGRYLRLCRRRVASLRAVATPVRSVRTAAAPAFSPDGRTWPTFDAASVSFMSIMLQPLGAMEHPPGLPASFLTSPSVPARWHGLVTAGG